MSTGQCGASRRRRTQKKKTSRRRRQGGGAYGVGAAITPGALEYGGAYTGPVNSSGAAIPDPTVPGGSTYTGIGGRRHRKSRKTRKTRGRKMRGGSAIMGAMKANAGFSGSGMNGMPDYADVNTSGPGSSRF